MASPECSPPNSCTPTDPEGQVPPVPSSSPTSPTVTSIDTSPTSVFTTPSTSTTDTTIGLPPTDSLITSTPTTSTPSVTGNSTPASAASTSSCSCTYSKSTTAGIGVGSAFAGALFAVCIGFIWFFKGRLRYNKSRNVFSHTGKPTAITLPGALDRLDDALPQALTHAELAKEASQLETAIRNYLDNYIDWDGSPKSPPLDDVRLSELAGGLRVDWRQKLHSKSSRSVTLRMFVARFLAARVNATEAAESTILPLDVMRTYQIVLAGQKRMLMGPAFQHAFQHTWRAMTAYLVSGDYPQDRESVSPNNRSYEAINREASYLREALAPLRCRRKGSEEREMDVLRELLAKAALLGLHMFSQRSATEFFWTQKFEVFPGLRQKPLLPGAMDGASWVTIREPRL